MAHESKRGKKIAPLVDRTKAYELKKALDLVKKTATAKFDESVDVAVRLGVNPKQADQIFNAFFTTKPRGMGMGLSICHNIIESHGGHLTGANNVDQGATFEFTLPARRETSDRVDMATA